MENTQNENAKVANDMTSFWERIKEAQQNSATNARVLARKLFDFLAANAVTGVTISFDGCGDSGQVENIDLTMTDGRTPNDLLALPFDEEGTHHDFDPATNKMAVVKKRTLRMALEDYAYDALEGGHPGWEINEGSYGEFTFDVAARQVHKKFNERIEMVNTTEEIDDL